MPEYNLTASVLSLLSNIGEKRQDQANIDDDRAFKMALEKYSLEATAKARMNEMAFGASLDALKSVQEEKRVLGDKATSLGIVAEGVTSEGATEAINRIASRMQTQTSTISQMEDSHLTNMKNIANEQNVINSDVTRLRGALASYYKGALDTSTANRIMTEFAKSTGETGMAQYTVSSDELSKAVGNTYASKPNELVGLQNTLQGLSKLYADYALDKEKADAAMLSAKAEMAKANDAKEAAMRDPFQREYNKYVGGLEKFAKDKGVSITEAEPEYIKQPGIKPSYERVQSMFKIDNEIKDNMTRINEIWSEVKAAYPGDDKDAKIERIRSKVAYKKMLDEKLIDIVPVSPAKRPGFIMSRIKEAWRTSGISGSTTKGLPSTTFHSIKDAFDKLRDESVTGETRTAIISGLRAEYPNIDSIINEEYENSLGEGGYSWDVALSNAEKRLYEEAKAKSKVK